MAFNSVCGLYYQMHHERLFLPQVQLQVRASIFETTSRVTLTQTFVNPSPTKAIREVKYVFPLYEGVSVVGFTCRVAHRLIVGEVKEKHEAKQDYDQAVARGETAGLFQQLDTSDTFMTTVGNVSPGAQVDVTITYLGELKHDMQVDGTRFTIPTAIAPRYGRTAPGSDAIFSRYASSSYTNGAAFSMTVDVDMAEGSFIQKILSPSHPISVSLGTTSLAPNDDPKLTKASATLSLGSVHLNTDFVLQIVAKHTGVPKAVLETHPSIPNQRALMATLVPKFALPAENPEIVFVCDRSGSMAYTNIKLAKQALQVFLKSLPVGVMFNICSFGDRFSFLWPRSVPYNQETLDQAVAHVSTFEANFGGTEMLPPLKATIEQRYRDMPLEVMMLTDGSIWDQQTLFTYVNKEVKETKAPIRVYSLGVGSGVSHALVEGLARAGNGFSQTVGEGENMDSKIVRMIKGAMSPHVNDYTLEVKYGGSAENNEIDEDFEIIDKVADSLKIKLSLPKEDEKKEPVSQDPILSNSDTDHVSQARPISLFDSTVDVDNANTPTLTNTAASRYAHLPTIQTPNIIQAPQSIPPLFAFNRTTVYLLLGPDAPRQTPKSVILRGTSTHGPLELELPVQVLDTPGETIHQLAVKKATYELEQGRGWLSEAKDEEGALVKERYEGRFSSMVEREAVRLGVEFQVGGKWCSFVAVEKKDGATEREKDGDWEFLEDEVAQADPSCHRPVITLGIDSSGPASQGMFFSSTQQQAPHRAGSLFGGLGQQPFGVTNVPHRGTKASLFGANAAASNAQAPVARGFGSAAPVASQGTSGGGLFGSKTPAFGQFAGKVNQGGSLFGNVADQPHQNTSGGLFGASAGSNTGGGLFGSATPAAFQSTFGGLFGSATTTTAFGGPSSKVNQGGSIFGNATNQSHQCTTGGLFGASAASSPPATGGLFGNATPAASQGTSGGLFGSATTAFGGPSSKVNQGVPLFGTVTKPPGGSISATNSFGSDAPASNTPAPVAGGGLFGNAPSMGAQSSPEGLFGSAATAPSKPASTGSGLFSNLVPIQNTLSRLSDGDSSALGSPNPVPRPPFVDNAKSWTFPSSPSPPGPVPTQHFSPLSSVPGAQVCNSISVTPSAPLRHSAVPPMKRGRPRLSAKSAASNPVPALAQSPQKRQMGAFAQRMAPQSQPVGFQAQMAPQPQQMAPVGPHPTGMVPQRGTTLDKRPADDKALTDYNMSLMLLEQQNKKRLLMARQDAPELANNTDQIVLDSYIPQYQQEMQSAAAMPLPDEDDEMLGLSMHDAGNTLDNFDFDSFVKGADRDVTAGNLNTRATYLDTASTFEPLSFASSPAMATPMAPQRAAGSAQFQNFSAAPMSPQAAPSTDEERSALLIKLQTFEGSWGCVPSLFLALQLDEGEVEQARSAFNGAVIDDQSKAKCDRVQWVTALTIVFFEDKLRSLQGSWELVVDKARNWLGNQVGSGRLEEILAGARSQYNP